MCMVSRAVGMLVSSAERRVLGRIVKKLGTNLDYLTCGWAVLNARCLGCAVWGQRVAVSLGTGSDASEPAGDSCATGKEGTPKESVPEQMRPVL